MMHFMIRFERGLIELDAEFWSDVVAMALRIADRENDRLVSIELTGG